MTSQPVIGSCAELGYEKPLTFWSVVVKYFGVPRRYLGRFYQTHAQSGSNDPALDHSCLETRSPMLQVFELGYWYILWLRYSMDYLYLANQGSAGNDKCELDIKPVGPPIFNHLQPARAQRFLNTCHWNVKQHCISLESAEWKSGHSRGYGCRTTALHP